MSGAHWNIVFSDEMKMKVARLRYRDGFDLATLAIRFGVAPTTIKKYAAEGRELLAESETA